ncbi:MAG: hypothetical protein RLZZ44_1530 [Bacteroidota bacterium]|jgi:DUF1680 family protein
MAEVGNYAYTLSKEGLYVNLFGSNLLTTTTLNGEKIQIEQQTNYPWDGKITLKVIRAPKSDFAFFLRIPGWSQGATVAVNATLNKEVIAGSYAKLQQPWKKGDLIELTIPMPVELIQANPLVEETKNQIAVKRGPIVYCLESNQLPEAIRVNQVSLNSNSKFEVEPFQLNQRNILRIGAEVRVNEPNQPWNTSLYQPLSNSNSKPIAVKLIPYFAWGNFAMSEMSVWLSY